MEVVTEVIIIDIVMVTAQYTTCTVVITMVDTQKIFALVDTLVNNLVMPIATRGYITWTNKVYMPFK